MERWWFEERVELPVRALAGDLPTGVVLTDAPPGILSAVENLFRSTVPEQWVDWPRGASTDGVAVDLAWRRDASDLVVAGRLWVGFAGQVVPVLVVFTVEAQGVGVTVHVGDVGPRTGRLPWPPDGYLLLDGGDDDRGVVPCRTEGRRLVPVEWTQVAVLGPDDLEA